MRPIADAPDQAVPDRIDGAILDVAAEILIVAGLFVGWAKLAPQ